MALRAFCLGLGRLALTGSPASPAQDGSWDWSRGQGTLLPQVAFPMGVGPCRPAEPPQMKATFSRPPRGSLRPRHCRVRGMLRSPSRAARGRKSGQPRSG